MNNKQYQQKHACTPLPKAKCGHAELWTSNKGYCLMCARNAEGEKNK